VTQAKATATLLVFKIHPFNQRWQVIKHTLCHFCSAHFILIYVLQEMPSSELGIKFWEPTHRRLLIQQLMINNPAKLLKVRGPQTVRTKCILDL
jgi:hypothetical protein